MDATLQPVSPASSAEWTAEEIWRAAVEGSGLGMWEWRMAWAAPRLSPRCAAMLGYGQSLPLTRRQLWRELIHPDDVGRLRTALLPALKGDRPLLASELRLKCRNGAWKWVLVRGAVIARDSLGRALHCVGTLSDVSERHAYIGALKQAEESSRAALQKLASFLEAINQHALVSVTDLAGTILEINDKFCKVSGYSHAELTGSNHRLLNSGHHPAVFFEEMWSTISQGQIWRGEICNRAKNGGLYWVDSAIVPQLDASGLPARYISVRIEITARKDNEQRIEHLARHDMLTGLPNRNLLEDRMQHAIARARRRREKFAVLFIDLDGFKDINDTQGHDAGDLLLRHVAQRLKTLLRAEDTLARHGGDEFIALLTDLKTGEEAGRVAEKLLQALAEPFHLAGKALHVGASIGIAIYPVDGQDAESLFKHGDIAMYQVKASGRNGYQFFTPVMQERVTERQELRQLLHEALHAAQLRLEYQPVVYAGFDQVGALDAQACWNHPLLGMLNARKLLQMAEEFGMAAELGTWIVRRACRQLVQWQQAGEHDIPRLILTLPGKLLEQAHFIDFVESELREHALRPESFAFGVRHAGVAEAETPALQLTRLHEAGFQLYLTGFGGGHCNMTALQSLPLRAIKLDPGMISSVTHSLQARAVVKAMIDLVHAMGFRVVAEGVDSAGQRDVLGGMDCDAWQGECIQAPMPATPTPASRTDAR